MIRRKKILLGDKDIKSRENKDFDITINLNKTYREIVPYKKENVFNQISQYQSERDNCRNFRIYGTIESMYQDCDNFVIHIFKEKPNLTDLTATGTVNINTINGYLKTSKTYPSISNSWDSKNLFFKKKGKFLIELDDYYESDFIYLFFPEIYDTQENLFKRQLVYRYKTLNLKGEEIIKDISYGQQNSIVDIDGNIVEVDNDFDFFYNKHWIKEEIKLSYIRPTSWKCVNKICLGTNRDTVFVPYEPSKSCNINQMKFYSELIEVFADTLAPIPGSNIIQNISANANYIPPVYSQECNNLVTLGIMNRGTVCNLHEQEGNGYYTLQDSVGNYTNNLFDFGEYVKIKAIPAEGYKFIGFDINPVNIEPSYPLPGPFSTPSSHITFGSPIIGDITNPISNELILSLTSDTVVKLNFAKEITVEIENGFFHIATEDATYQKYRSHSKEYAPGIYKFPKGIHLNILLAYSSQTSNISITNFKTKTGSEPYIQRNIPGGQLPDDYATAVNAFISQPHYYILPITENIKIRL